MTKTASLVASPLENLKGFAASRPPVVVFMVCIALISIILMTLAFIVKDNELKKPDVSQVKHNYNFLQVVVRYSLIFNVNYRLPK